MSRLTAMVAHALHRTCRDADCGPCSFVRAEYASRNQAARDLVWSAQIALHRAANGRPIRRRLGRLTVNRVAELAAERGCELRLDLRPVREIEEGDR